MKLRFALVGATALALTATATFAAPARAEDPIDAEVGGGAAGISAALFLQSYELGDLLLGGKDRALVAVSEPRVTLSPNGGGGGRQVLNQRLGPVTAKVARVEIKGNRQGKPFAEASTVLTGLKIAGGPSFSALETHCLWDRYGPPTGSTTIVNADGTSYEPAPNTVIPIPGVGSLTLNEQYGEEIYRYDRATGEYKVFSVIYVFGAHLRLLAELEDLYGTGDIIVGFTSCDPLVLPNLSGLKLAKTPSD